jgi:hypothetical protein
MVILSGNSSDALLALIIIIFIFWLLYKILTSDENYKQHRYNGYNYYNQTNKPVKPIEEGPNEIDEEVSTLQGSSGIQHDDGKKPATSEGESDTTREN